MTTGCNRSLQDLKRRAVEVGEHLTDEELTEVREQKDFAFV